MTEVIFYILGEQASHERLHSACQVTEKALAQGRRVYIHCTDAEQAQRMDELLWTFRQNSFVPHELEGGDETSPVHIGHQGEADGHEDVLINLSDEVPQFFSRFHRLVELVDNGNRETGREHYRFYRQRGYPLQNHNI